MMGLLESLARRTAIKRLVLRTPYIQNLINSLEETRREMKLLQDDPRYYLSHRFLRGEGIEIGAAHRPLPVAPGVRVRYVDMASTPDLRKLWPEMAEADLVEVEIVDDGEKLSKVDAESQDFVIANHFIEHCIDPIGTLFNLSRVLRDNGILFMAIPDKGYTFDIDRPVTTYEHLVEEFESKGEGFKREHTLEYVLLAEKHEGDPEPRVDALIESGYRIHYHVFNELSMMEMFTRATRDFKLPFELHAMLRHNDEVIFAIRKTERHHD